MDSGASDKNSSDVDMISLDGDLPSNIAQNDEIYFVSKQPVLEHLTKTREKRKNIRRPTVRNPHSTIEIEMNLEENSITDFNNNNNNHENKNLIDNESNKITPAQFKTVEQPKISLNALGAVRLRQTATNKQISNETNSTKVANSDSINMIKPANKLSNRFSMFEQTTHSSNKQNSTGNISSTNLKENVVLEEKPMKKNPLETCVVPVLVIKNDENLRGYRQSVPVKPVSSFLSTPPINRPLLVQKNATNEIEIDSMPNEVSSIQVKLRSVKKISTTETNTQKNEQIEENNKSKNFIKIENRFSMFEPGFFPNPNTNIYKSSSLLKLNSNTDESNKVNDNPKYSFSNAQNQVMFSDKNEGKPISVKDRIKLFSKS